MFIPQTNMMTRKGDGVDTHFAYIHLCTSSPERDGSLVAEEMTDEERLLEKG
jgi:hypothetical protein